MAVERKALSILEKRLRGNGLEVLTNEPMRSHTSYRIGGPADIFVAVRNVEQLALAVNNAIESAVPYFLLGGGTNVLFGDRGYRGLVICNRCAAVKVDVLDGLSSTRHHSGLEEMLAASVYAESGMPLAALSRQMTTRGWGDLTWAEGIPGTLGGAIVNNAGAFGSSMADVVLEVSWMDAKGNRGSWDAESLELGYRTSRLRGKREWIILSTRLGLTRQDSSYLQQRSREYAKQRKRSQPTGASAGSVFKNPANGFAGRLIEEAGLKGRRVGGARISEKHANFIINDGEASAQDVRTLIEEIRETVLRRLGVELELEIELVGEF